MSGVNEQDIVGQLSTVGMAVPYAQEIAREITSLDGERVRINMAYLENCSEACFVISRFLKEIKKEKLYLTLHNYRIRELFADRQDVAVLLRIARESSLNSLALRGVYLGAEGYKALNESLTNGGISSLRLEISDLSEHMDLFTLALEDTLVDSLELQANQLDQSRLEILGTAIGKLTQLEYLDIGRNAYLAGFEGILSRLPDTLISLNLSETKSPHRDMDFLAERLPSLRYLTHMDLSLCQLSEESITILANVLPNTNLTDLDLSYNPLTDKGAEALITALSHPKSILYQTGLTGEKSDLAPKYKAEIAQLEKANRAKIDEVYAGEVKEHLEKQSSLKNANEIQTAVKQINDIETLKESGLLFAAAKASRIEAVYGRLNELQESLKPEDYFLTDNYGKTLLSLIGNAKQLGVAFAPEHWQNPQQMQTVFDALPLRQKIQLDGKKGRPSFRTYKNEVMKNGGNSAKQSYFF